MKKITSVLLFAMFFIVSCSKDDNKPASYEEINRADIKAREGQLTDDPVAVSNAGGIIWKAGDVYIFKNRVGVFGKFKVIAIDPANNYELRIAAVIYNTDGTVAEQTDGIGIRGTWGCDLAILAEAIDFANTDFSWSRETQTNTTFNPANGAVFMKYNF